MAEMLKIDPDAVFGKLVRVWFWFDEQTENGNAPNVTASALARIIDSRVGVEGFAKAMRSVGWLSGISMPNFDRHNGKSAKNRALTANRMERHRNGAAVTPSSPDKIREDKKKDTTPTGVGARTADPVKDEIWNTLRPLLYAEGKSKETAGSFIGKLLKDFGRLLVLQASRDCAREAPLVPSEWLVARCQERRSAGANKQLGLEERNRETARQAAAEMAERESHAVK